MSGLAMTAGSTPIFSATIGSVLPTTFANMTTNTIVRLTVAATMSVTASLFRSIRSTSSILMKFAAASDRPHKNATRSSFQMTFRTSAGSISPSDRLRMTAVDAWLPELPPVPISIGMNAASATCVASASSKCVTIMPVNVADSIKNISHGIRFFQMSTALVREYGLSDGVSSVASCSMTSMTSSTVTMPTRQPSLSTTGIAIRS